MKKIPLSRGLFALVDDEDYDELNKYNWNATEVRGAYYARRYVGFQDGKSITIKMHQQIMGENGADHINGDGLDNRRSNLRPATEQQNRWNRGPQENNKSGFKGVVFHKRLNRWCARIGAHGNRYHLGYFDSAEEAARAYDAAAIEYHGEFAFLNLPGAASQEAA